MIDRVLIKYYINQSLLLFAACGAVLFGFAWIRVWVGTFFNLQQYEGMLDQFSEFEDISPVEFSTLLTYHGQVGMVYDEPIVIACIVIWCVSRGSDVVSGNLGRGTLEMLLSQPISRTRLMVSHALVSVLGLATLCGLVWAGISLGIQTNTVQEVIPAPTFHVELFGLEVDVPLGTLESTTQDSPLRDHVDPMTYLAATTHLFAFGFVILAFASFISSLDRYRWRTVGIVVGMYVTQVIFYGLGYASKSASWLLNLTILSCYKPQKMTSLVAEQSISTPFTLQRIDEDLTLAPVFYPLILVCLGIVFFALAIRSFERRDLPAPL